MADPIIRLKRSSVSGKIPSPANVPLGELALNTYDGYLYASKDVGAGVTVIAINPFRVGAGTDAYNTYFTVGNVGIGTTNPTTKLQVGGVIGFNNTNVRIGDANTGSLLTSVATHNILIGSGVGNSITGGDYNVAIGFNAGGSLSVNNSHNILLGALAGYDVSGNNNIIFGESASYFASGNNNIVMGFNSGFELVGNENTLLGYYTGPIQSTGTGNVYVGSQCGLDQQSGSYNIAIGYDLNLPILTGSNQLAIGVGTNRWIVGNSSYNVGIGTTNPTQKLDVGGVARANRFVSTQTTGTEPFTVSSTTVVTNLNSDLLDGQEGSYYLNYNNFSNTPTIGNGTLTLNVSGTGLSGSQTFTANQTGNATFTVTSNATSANTSSTIVARDASGNFSANTITLAGQLNGPSEFVIDPSVVGNNTGLVRIKGDLYVDGTTTQINSTTIELADFIVGIATTATTDLLSDGAGIQIGPDNTFLYEYNSGTNPSLKSSENLNVASGKHYQIGETEVLSATTLGSGVVNSSLTSVGTITTGTWDASTIAIARGGTNGSATPTAGAIAYGTGTAYTFSSAGTSNQVLLSGGTGSPTWANQSTLSVGTATTATNATNTTVTISSANSAFKVPFVNTTGDATGNYGLLHDGSTFTYNPSTNTLVVGSFSGSGASLTQLNASNISSGTLPIARGGTNSASTPTAGGVPYGTGSQYAFTPAGTSSQVLLSGGTGSPTWANQSTLSVGTATTATNVVGTANRVLYNSATNTTTTSGNLTFNGTNLGIGTNNPTVKLDVNGDVSIASTVSIGTTIDIVPYNNLGTLSFEGSAGQLFSITNNLTSGSIFSVNDVSGFPSIDVDADGTIQLAPLGTTEFVGIGTTNPTQKLDVNGNVAIGGSIYDANGLSGTNGQVLSNVTGFGVSWTNAGGGGTPSGSDGQVQYNNGGSFGGASALYYDDVNTRIGIGTTNPTQKLDVNGATRFRGAIYDNNNVVGAANSVLTSTGSGVVWAAPSGGGSQVSVGTEAPTSPSQGDLWYHTDIGRTFVYYQDGTSNQWVDASPFYDSAEPVLTPGKTSQSFTATEGQTTFTFSYEVGYIEVYLNGVRLSSSEYTASNGATVILSTGASAGDIVDIVEFIVGIGDTGSGGPLENIENNTTANTYYPLFAVGVGTTTPYITTTSNYFEFTPNTGTLDVNNLTTGNSIVVGSAVTITSGGITASGIITATDFNSTSDITLKTNIKPIDNPIDKVLQINGVSFDWKETQRSSAGVIAQDVEKVLPQLVNGEDTKTVNYNGLIGVLIEAVKEQQEQINTLKEEITKLKG